MRRSDRERTWCGPGTDKFRFAFVAGTARELRKVLEQYERSEQRRLERSELGQANHAARFTNVTKLRGPTHLRSQVHVHGVRLYTDEPHARGTRYPIWSFPLSDFQNAQAYNRGFPNSGWLLSRTTHLPRSGGMATLLTSLS